MDTKVICNTNKILENDVIEQLNDKIIFYIGVKMNGNKWK